MALSSLGPQVLLFQLSILGGPDVPLQYPPLDHDARLVCATGAHLSAEKTDSVLIHERLPERWKRIWVGLRIVGALLGRMIETALAIDALYLCLVGE